ncbi:hypothetical protein [Streptomyces sp. NPDC102476]|uniref:hypothetical protein n=1 Tax=Streptomyces sp. NPDC102476 TaxID=3366181 RepID=UPI0038283FCA
MCGVVGGERGQLGLGQRREDLLVSGVAARSWPARDSNGTTAWLPRAWDTETAYRASVRAASPSVRSWAALRPAQAHDLSRARAPSMAVCAVAA